VFWWDALGDATRELDARVRDHALNALAGTDERVRAWAASAGVVARDNLPAYARAASTTELAAAAKRPGISIGSHTWSHPNLTRLSPADLAHEMTRSLHWVRSECGSSCVSWLAYPYGLESRNVREAAASAGYAGAVRIDGGWQRGAPESAFARPRLNVGAGMSVYGLRARVCGSWPA
jgi:peptidoglycan/xylan/chitin deacetylase (PgdA/CDA1 family)